MKNILFALVVTLLYVACGNGTATTTEVKKNPLPDFIEALKAIQVTDFTAIDAATTLFDSLRKDLPNPAVADTLFYPYYWSFYQQAGQQAINQLSGGDTTQMAQIEKVANDYGFEVRATEQGILSAPGNKQYLKTKVIPYLSETLAMYVQQVINQNSLRNPNAADIGMNVLFWENFAKKNPNHPLAADAQARFRASLPFLLMGTPNDPLFKPGGLESTYPVVYNQIIMKEGDSQVTPILMNYLDVLKKNGFKRTPEVDAFVQQYQ